MSWKRLFILLIISYISYGQSKKKLLSWINEGKDAFEQKAFLRAASHFQKVINAGKKGLYEEAALYLAGLSYYYAKDYPTAITYLQHLLDYYPNSGYADWAKYHKGLSMLENPNKKEGGYYVLLRLYEETSDAGLKERVKNAVFHYWLKKEPLKFLRSYRFKVRKSFKPYLYEILAYRLYEDKDLQGTRNIITEARKEGISSVKLVKLERTLNSLKVTRETGNDYDTLRITILLPFYATSQASRIEKRSLPATEFLAGIETALSKNYSAAPKIKLQVLDTWKDKNRLQQYLNNDVKKFNPHIIIGELYRTQSEALANYSKEMHSLIFVPFVNRKHLFEINQNVYLQNPSLFKQGQSLAKYVTENQNKKKILVIFDGKEKNYEYNQGIIDGLNQAKGIHYSSFVLVGSDLKSQTTELYNRLKTALQDENTEAIFFVSDSYDLSEFFISKLAVLDENAEVLILGHPKWYFFKNLNKIILAERKSVIPGAYEPVNNPAEYSYFRNKYASLFNQNIPPFYAVQGYDAMRMICLAYANVNQWKNNKDIFSKLESQKGIAQNYYWGQANSNQSVILLQYNRTGFTPLYLWKK